MYTIGISAYGGPDALTRLDVPDPHPDSGEVLVEVAASGVNNADLLQRRGLYPPPLGAPDWPGLECSGWIAELGDDVFGWKVGDEVCALVSGGAYAQKVVVPMGQLLPVPAGVSLVDAAALPEAVCTVWLNMMQIGRLSPGESVLVHGGAGGVGSAAVQIARSAGARVLATAGSMEKCRFCLELGADVAVCYKDEDFVQRVFQETNGRGVDVILDPIGGTYLARNIKVLATGGRLAVIGLQQGLKGELNLGRLLAKQGTVFATSLRTRSLKEKAAIVDDVCRNVWPKIDQGAVRPFIGQIFPIDRAADAHRLMESGKHFGKILLQHEAASATSQLEITAGAIADASNEESK